MATGTDMTTALAIPRHFLTSVIMTCVNDNGSVSLIRESAPSVRLFVKKYRPNVPDSEDVTYVLCIMVGNSGSTPIDTGTKGEMEGKLKDMARSIAAQISKNPKSLTENSFKIADALKSSKKVLSNASNVKVRASWVFGGIALLVVLYFGYVAVIKHHTPPQPSQETAQNNNINPSSQAQNEQPHSSVENSRQQPSSLSALGLVGN